MDDDGVRGVVERVTFHNEESGFSVLRVLVRGRKELVTVIGNVATVTPGEWITAEGRWVRDREHGMQLKAGRVETQPPDSREGIEKYLASGMIKGIGPVYAKKLVAQFGEEVFSIIENESARLQEVGGIGAERRRAIKDAWAEQRVVREIMVFLHANGVSTSRAVRVYKTYGDEAIGRIRSDPYCLARDIRGIGFKTADAIAAKLGLAGDSVLRVRAGLAHCLDEAGSDGHCAMVRGELVRAAEELLSVEGELAERVLAGAVERGELCDEGGLIYSPPMLAAERLVAEQLRAMAGRENPGYPEIDAERASGLGADEDRKGVGGIAGRRAAAGLGAGGGGGDGRAGGGEDDAGEFHPQDSQCERGEVRVVRADWAGREAVGGVDGDGGDDDPPAAGAGAGWGVQAERGKSAGWGFVRDGRGLDGGRAVDGEVPAGGAPAGKSTAGGRRRSIAERGAGIGSAGRDCVGDGAGRAAGRGLSAG